MLKVHLVGWDFQRDFWVERASDACQPPCTETIDWRSELQPGSLVDLRLRANKWDDGIVIAVDMATGTVLVRPRLCTGFSACLMDLRR